MNIFENSVLNALTFYYLGTSNKNLMVFISIIYFLLIIYTRACLLSECDFEKNKWMYFIPGFRLFKILKRNLDEHFIAIAFFMSFLGTTIIMMLKIDNAAMSGAGMINGKLQALFLLVPMLLTSTFAAYLNTCCYKEIVYQISSFCNTSKNNHNAILKKYTAVKPLDVIKLYFLPFCSLLEYYNDITRLKRRNKRSITKSFVSIFLIISILFGNVQVAHAKDNKDVFEKNENVYVMQDIADVLICSMSDEEMEENKQHIKNYYKDGDNYDGYKGREFYILAPGNAEAELINEGQLYVFEKSYPNCTMIFGTPCKDVHGHVAEIIIPNISEIQFNEDFKYTKRTICLDCQCFLDIANDYGYEVSTKKLKGNNVYNYPKGLTNESFYIKRVINDEYINSMDPVKEGDILIDGLKAGKVIKGNSNDIVSYLEVKDNALTYHDFVEYNKTGQIISSKKINQTSQNNNEKNGTGNLDSTNNLGNNNDKEKQKQKEDFNKFIKNNNDELKDETLGKSFLDVTLKTLKKSLVIVGAGVAIQVIASALPMGTLILPLVISYFGINYIVELYQSVTYLYDKNNFSSHEEQMYARRELMETLLSDLLSIGICITANELFNKMFGSKNETSNMEIEESVALTSTQNNIPVQSEVDTLYLVEKASSVKLRRNMIKAGVEVPDYPNAAHHIVAGGDIRAAESRAILTKYGIGLNDAENGVFLPTSKEVTTGTYHPSLNSNSYNVKVYDLMVSGSSKGDIIDILSYIATELQNGTFMK